MRFLRGTILAIGLMSFAVACGGSKKEAAEPMPDTAGDPAGEGMGEEGMGEEGMGEEGMGEENPCGAGEEDPCAGADIE